MPKLLGEVTAILMAKRPTSGQVKTRLVKEGCLSADEASQLAWEMLLCTANRLTGISKTVLAVSPDGDAQQLASDLGVQFDNVVGQGEGNLGQRLDRVWNIIGTDKPIAFFGGDIPDVPLSHLAEIPSALENNDIAIGPTDDGGYWTLAARSYFPRILEEIDWGSDMVYDQTCNRAAQAGLSITHLKLWYDVDHQEDLVALRSRLQQILSSSLENEEDYEALGSLAQRVEKIAAIMGVNKIVNSMTEPNTTRQTQIANAAEEELDLVDAKILLVDDNQQNLELMQAYLESLPCKLSTARDGQQAYQSILDDPPDLVLLDVMMPRMSGFELCQKVKSSPSTRDVVIIMVTALHEVGDFERAVECGTDDFLTKPVNKLELLTRVRSLLRVRLLKKKLDQLSLKQRSSPDDRDSSSAAHKLDDT